MGNKEAPQQPRLQEPQKSDADKLFEATFEFKMMVKQYKKESEKSAQAQKNSIKKVKDVILIIKIRLLKRIYQKLLEYMLLMQLEQKTKSQDISTLLLNWNQLPLV